jgi:hypothetical protein
MNKEKTVKKTKETFDFGETLKRIKAGKCVQRLGWNGKGMARGLRQLSLRRVRDNPCLFDAKRSRTEATARVGSLPSVWGQRP